jgi:hypothetical protein
MKKFIYLSAVAILLAILSGCSTRAPVMSMGNDVYTVSKAGTTGFTPLGRLRQGAYDIANEYALEKRKTAEVISVNEVPQGFGRFPEVEVRFRLVDSSSSSNLSSNLKISNTASYDAMGNRRDTETTISKDSTTDAYEKLNALGKLRDNGVLTEEEFQKEKEKLLQGSR